MQQLEAMQGLDAVQACRGVDREGLMKAKALSEMSTNSAVGRRSHIFIVGSVVATTDKNFHHNLSVHSDSGPVFPQLINLLLFNPTLNPADNDNDKMSFFHRQFVNYIVLNG